MANILTKLLPLPGFRMPDVSHLNSWATAINNAFNGVSTIGGMKTSGAIAVQNASAATAGGVNAIAIGSGGLVIAWGSGAPTLSAGQGSLYLRTDGSSTSTRLYVNTNGSTTWTDFTSAA